MGLQGLATKLAVPMTGMEEGTEANTDANLHPKIVTE